jgi:two-component system, NtrC family, response regulator HydG
LKSEKAIQGISNAAVQALIGYPWPGNVRELKSALEYAFVTCNESVIRPEHLPPNIAHGGAIGQPPHLTHKDAGSSRDAKKRQRLIEALRQAGGNQRKASEMLGVSRVTVWKQIKRYDIDLHRDMQ